MGTTLWQYALLTAPALAILATCYVVTRRLFSPILSIMVLILALVLIRDAMTPMGFWQLSTPHSFAVEVRFTNDITVLIGLSISTALAAAAILATDQRLRALVVWGRGTPVPILSGITAAVVIAAPVLLVSGLVAPSPGTVPLTVLPALLVFCFVGNFFEELLFRGFLQGHLASVTTAMHAAVISGLVFGACHTFLATTVTDLGLPLLLFTTWEGLICAWLRMRFGLIPAVIAHAGAIALLSSGLL